MTSFTFHSSTTALLIVDMQEKIFASVDRGVCILNTMCKLVLGFRFLNLPIFIVEQSPEALGSTIKPLKNVLGDLYQPMEKSTFSCLNDEKISSFLLSLPFTQWLVVGIEAHICVLQTVKGLINAGKQTAVSNDLTSSRSIYDFSTAIAEMRDARVRITSAETILFELLKDSKHPHFKSISHLIKTPSCVQCE